MRKISIDSARAFLNGSKFERDNTKVEISDNNKYSYMYLFGNWIARKNLVMISIILDIYSKKITHGIYTRIQQTKKVA